MQQITTATNSCSACLERESLEDFTVGSVAEANVCERDAPDVGVDQLRRAFSVGHLKKKKGVENKRIQDDDTFLTTGVRVTTASLSHHVSRI